ncbi:MAG TPA: formate dehydrogenase accessory sulfurtransferase FdhD, partial [Methanomicrobiales archaeon]|nr:formate dehydrogenase accessory sulfurtransferase FdhD [Methanomicrobiales archaeon]
MIEEVAVTLNVNGRHAMTAMTSPVDIGDFITGYLFTEQIVKGLEEIVSLKIEKNVVSVLTADLRHVIGPKKVILSGCGGDSSFLDVKQL